MVYIYVNWKYISQFLTFHDTSLLENCIEIQSNKLLLAIIPAQQSNIIFSTGELIIGY